MIHMIHGFTTAMHPEISPCQSSVFRQKFARRQVLLHIATYADQFLMQKGGIYAAPH